jgi:hypothetical protein
MAYFWIIACYDHRPSLFEPRANPTVRAFRSTSSGNRFVMPDSVCRSYTVSTVSSLLESP